MMVHLGKEQGFQVSRGPVTPPSVAIHVSTLAQGATPYPLDMRHTRVQGREELAAVTTQTTWCVFAAHNWHQILQL